MGKVGVGKKKKGGNAGVGVDFKRVKHKVGKKLPKAQNETNVSFKAASINLPNQAIQQDRDGLALNFQNLTLQAGYIRACAMHLKGRCVCMHGSTRAAATVASNGVHGRHPLTGRQGAHIGEDSVSAGRREAPVQGAGNTWCSCSDGIRQPFAQQAAGC